VEKKMENQKRWVIIKDERIDRAIETVLYESGGKDYADELKSRFQDVPFYYWGGLVRGAVFRALYGFNGKTKDIDVIIDDSKKSVDLFERMNGLNNVQSTRFGTPKWKPEKGMEIDLSTFEDSSKTKGFSKLNIKNVLKHCDFTPSAIAYCPKTKTLYSYGAIESIKNKEIDLNFSGDETCVLLARMILLSNKLMFKIGKKAIDYIKQNYSSKQDNQIKTYLEYKNNTEQYNTIIRTLKQISD
jgi:hypothetical protein